MENSQIQTHENTQQGTADKINGKSSQGETDSGELGKPGTGHITQCGTDKTTGSH